MPGEICPARDAGRGKGTGWSPVSSSGGRVSKLCHLKPRRLKTAPALNRRTGKRARCRSFSKTRPEPGSVDRGRVRPSPVNGPNVLRKKLRRRTRLESIADVGGRDGAKNELALYRRSRRDRNCPSRTAKDVLRARVGERSSGTGEFFAR